MVDIHRDPERLRLHAARADRLAEILLQARRAPAADVVEPWRRAPAGAAVADRIAELSTTIERAAAALADLAARLHTAAADAESFDAGLGRRIRLEDGPA
ncbi:MAG TPA: hypothetical protein VD813_07580 [Pseudonocardia sp.]|nr:hypothetical protein [Pseudonocardia sp.]